MDELVFRGIREFNEGKFFEAHDSFEEIWQGYRDPDREFLQALSMQQSLFTTSIIATSKGHGASSHRRAQE